MTEVPSTCQWRLRLSPGSLKCTGVMAKLWSVMRKARSARQRVGRCARYGEIAALYIMWRRLTTPAAAIATGMGESAAISWQTISCAMPEKARIERAIPSSGVRPEAMDATPATNPKGIAPRSTGVIARAPALNSSRGEGMVMACGKSAILVQRAFARLHG